MRSYTFYFFLLVICTAGTAGWAGNPERSGQAGASQLLINPFARSSGIGGMNIASCYGIESVINNPAGLAELKRSEFLFSHTRWLEGSDIRINAFGFGQKLGSESVIGFSAMAFDLGEIQRTTIAQPDGGIGTFSPTLLNLNLSYAHAFLDGLIKVGATVKVVHESISDAASNGVAFDAGVQYKSENQRFKLGVALRNVGPTMKYSGDGLSFRALTGGQNSTFDNNVFTNAADYQMPSVLSIGLAYTFPFGGTDSLGNVDAPVKLTPTAAFISNTFSNDQFGVGVEATFIGRITIRGAYLYEEGANDQNFTGADVFSGISAGLSADFPFGKNKNGLFAVDYSYSHTLIFNGTHSVGIRLNF